MFQLRGVQLCDAVRTPGIKRRCLRLRSLLHFSEQLARRGLVELHGIRQAADADRFQDAERSQPIRHSRVMGLVKAHLHVALCAKVVNLVRFSLLDYANKRDTVRKVSVVQRERQSLLVLIVKEVVDALRVEQRCSALDSMNLVTLRQKELCEVRTVLPGDAGDKRRFHLNRNPSASLAPGSIVPEQLSGQSNKFGVGQRCASRTLASRLGATGSNARTRPAVWSRRVSVVRRRFPSSSREYQRPVERLSHNCQDEPGWYESCGSKSSIIG